MEETMLYGASDDLFEISGKYSEELNPSGDEIEYVCVSDGTMLELQYDETGQWRMRLQNKGTSFDRIIQAVGEDANHESPYEKCSSYSDVAIFTGPIKWVSLSTRQARFK